MIDQWFFELVVDLRGLNLTRHSLYNTGTSRGQAAPVFMAPTKSFTGNPQLHLLMDAKAVAPAGNIVAESQFK